MLATDPTTKANRQSVRLIIAIVYAGIGWNPGFCYSLDSLPMDTITISIRSFIQPESLNKRWDTHWSHWAVSSLLPDGFAAFPAPLTMFLIMFLSLNHSSLISTALWFRIDHANPTSRRYRERYRAADNEGKGKAKTDLVLLAEVQWQYSLRSNLLLWGCASTAYLICTGQSDFVLLCLCIVSLVNIVMDELYRYAPMQKNQASNVYLST